MSILENITAERLGFPGQPDRPVTVAFGGGVDSTALLVALKHAGIKPAWVSFADTGGEKQRTYDHVALVSDWLKSWAGIEVEVVKYNTLASTSYNDLLGNCLDNETLPTVSFPGIPNSCSSKWKKQPQEYAWRGAKSGPNKRDPHPLYLSCQERGVKAWRLIGFDAGPADLKRGKGDHTSKLFDQLYPLQHLGWDRPLCIQAIEAEGLPVPPKSSCFFCGAMKEWEIWDLAATEPEKLTLALRMEYGALTGKHSRWQDPEFGRAWEDYVKTGDKFPSAETSCGLGIKRSWCQWAYVNGLARPETNWVFEGDQEACAAKRDALVAGDDNALDGRSGCSARSDDALVTRLRNLYFHNPDQFLEEQDLDQVVGDKTLLAWAEAWDEQQDDAIVSNLGGIPVRLVS
jgi:hypothetical protein